MLLLIKATYLLILLCAAASVYLIFYNSREEKFYYERIQGWYIEKIWNRKKVAKRFYPNLATLLFLIRLVWGSVRKNDISYATPYRVKTKIENYVQYIE